MSRVADELGKGASFGRARPVSARRSAVAAATGVPTEGVAPPTELSVWRVSLNPDNPRSSLGDLTDLAGSLKDHGQKAAITVMNRDAYVKANPKHEEDLEEDTTHVVVDGSSRLAAAREAGLLTLKVMVDDDQGGNQDELLESALVANIHRQDLAPMDEARALQRLKVIHGTQEALAKRLHRSQGWVSQRLALLELTDELKARVGSEPIEFLRAVGNKPPGEQEATLQRLKDERDAKEAAKQERKRKASHQPSPADTSGAAGKLPGASAAEAAGAEAHYGVMNPAAPAAENATDTEAHYGVMNPASVLRAEAATRMGEELTKPRTEHGTVPESAAEMPWESGDALAELVIQRMHPAEIRRLTLRLINHNSEQAEGTEATSTPS